MPKFTPQDPKDMSGGDFELLAPGEYDFEVFEAKESRSKAGSDMIALTLKVYDKDREYRVWDYLVFGEKSLFKVYQFCIATGMVKEYNSGDLTAFDCQGKTGELRIGVQPAKDGFDAKNMVKAYVAKSEPVTVAPDEGDDIPF